MSPVNLNQVAKPSIKEGIMDAIKIGVPGVFNLPQMKSGSNDQTSETNICFYLCNSSVKKGFRRKPVLAFRFMFIFNFYKNESASFTNQFDRFRKNFGRFKDCYQAKHIVHEIF
jgi:hypothetical protein